MDIANEKTGGSGRKRTKSSRRPLIETLESRQLLSASPIATPSIILSSAATSSSAIDGYTPAQIRGAYGITGTGSGQTIAIVDAYSDPNIASDLAVFDKEFGLGAPASFKQESAAGSTTSLPAENAGWDGEIALDVEWAHAIAPGASIILVDAASDSLTNLLAAVNYARNISSVSVVSMSWGSSEFSGETSYDSYFTTPTGHIGITFVAASGDEGASEGAEWPAVSSDVLAVGGTTLDLSSTDTITSETAWSDSSGGASKYETLAAQESATGLSTRNSPDVSFDANPDTGVAVYDSVAYDGYVGWQEVGGTSVGAPSWAGIIAIVDSQRVAASLSTLTTAQTLADVYSIYSNATSYADDFHDITSGSSVLSEGGGGGFGGGGPGGFGGFRGGRGGGSQATYVSATAGYDTLTGVGSPDGTGLIAALASSETASITASAVSKGSTVSKSTLALLRPADLLRGNELAALQGMGSVAQVAPPQSQNTSAPQFAIARTAIASLSTNGEPSITSYSSDPFTDGTLVADGLSAVGAAAGNELHLPAAGFAFSVSEPQPSPSQNSFGFADQIAVELNVVVAAAKPQAVQAIPGELVQVIRDTEQDAKRTASVLSSTVEMLKGDSGGLIVAFAIADAMLLGYFYENCNRQKRTSFESLFSTVLVGRSD